ncbi:MAG: hypothetical protein ABIH74_02280 [Candidatus Omnitrophota bacterium]
MRIAIHELFHHLNPAESEEVTLEATGDKLEDILAKFSAVNKKILAARANEQEQEKVEEMYRLSDIARRGDLKAMKAFLMGDTEYGSAARKIIQKLSADGKTDESDRFVEETFMKRYNIDLTKTALTRRPYEGYDYILVVSSTEDEARSKGEILKGIFGDLNVKVFSGVAGNGGQLIDEIRIFESASRAGLPLREILARNEKKIGIWHDGGKGERSSPLAQSLSNSRGRQALVGSFRASSGELTDAELLLYVILNSLDFARSNDGSSSDTYWTSQDIAGTVRHTAIERSNASYSKFMVPIDWSVSPELLHAQLFQFGTMTTDERGFIQNFYGNQTRGAAMKTATGGYALNPEHAHVHADLKDSPQAGFDFGSYSMNNAMKLALWNYWVEKRDENGTLIIDHSIRAGEIDAKWKRDIDPHFTQPLAFLLQAIGADSTILVGTTPAEILRRYTGDERKMALQEDVALIRKRLPGATRIRMGEIVLDENDRVKEAKELDFVTETIEFFLLNRDNVNIFGDLTRVIGTISLGVNAEWQTYRGALDVANEKLFMLTDLGGKVISIDKNGTLSGRSATAQDAIRAENARRKRNIDNAHRCDFHVNGKHIVLSVEDVAGAKPWTGEGVTIHNSIVQGSDLLPGSEIIDSVVDNSQGVIRAKSSYVQKTTAVEVRTVNSMVHMVVSKTPVAASGEIICDVFRPEIKDNRFHPGQTRLRMTAAYDPKVSDGTLVGDNIYTAAEVRDMACVRSQSDKIEEDAKGDVRVLLEKMRANRAFWMKNSSPLSFGTSGLRAKVTDMTDMEVYINARGFIRFLIETGEIEVPGREDETGVMPNIPVAGDLRSSTPRITRAVIKAIEDGGCQPVYLGNLPTEALAYYAMQNEMPSIMVTGSHIPDDRNGIKFTKRSGEVLKADEGEILRNVSKAREEEYAGSLAGSLFTQDGSFKTERPMISSWIDSEVDMNELAANFYINRYLNAFPGRPLEGIKVVLYEHSAVGRDITRSIFEALGAEVIPVERSDNKFIPVDTEKISPETRRIVEGAAAEHQPYAVISTDGDSDRPLLADETGRILPGDKLGALAAMSLGGVDFAAVPISSNDGTVRDLLKSGIEVRQTRIGSPYVIKAMNDRLAEDPDARVVSWEVNGGFLMGSDRSDLKLKALPTRDAMLPLISVLVAAKQAGVPVSRYVDNLLSPRYTAADVVDNKTPGCESYTADIGKALARRFLPSDENIAHVVFDRTGSSVKVVSKADFMNVIESPERAVEATPEQAADLLRIRETLSRYFTEERGFEPIVSLNFVDSVRVGFESEGEENYHIRPSGNAPEFRNYTAAGTEARADELVAKREAIVAHMVADMTKGAEADLSPGVHAIRSSEDKELTDEGLDRTLRRVRAALSVKAVREGTPLYIRPHRDARVWGRDGIGEYWYGAEGGENDSLVYTTNTLPPVITGRMSEVVRTVPEELLGAGVTARYGHRLPLVKMLDPVKRLSVQIHDTKNELWVVTGVDRALAGRNPAIILGFSPEIVEKYGDEVTEYYQRTLKTYGDALNTLIGRLEATGHGDLLNKTGDAVIAAEQVAGERGNQHIEEALVWLKGLRGDLDFFYNYRTVEEGDVIPIPAGTLHALTPGIQVVEPQIAGSTQAMEDGATYPVRYAFPGHEREGAKKVLDVERAGEINPEVVVGSAPEVIDERESIVVERLPGGFEDKGLEVHRITLSEGAEIVEEGITSFHTLVATEENAAQIVVGGKTYTIPKAATGGEMLIIPASAGEYKIVASKPVQIIDTFTPVPPKDAVSSRIVKSGEEIAKTGKHVYDRSVEFAEFPAKTAVTDTVSVIGAVAVDPIIEGRAHDVTVTQGTARIALVESPAFDVAEGETVHFDAGRENYVVVKTGNDNVEVRVNYEKTKAETLAYSAYNAVRKHVGKIQAAGQIDLILPEEMFTRGGENEPGSAKFEERELRAGLKNNNIRITTYSARLGLAEAAKRSVSEGAVAILVATESGINDADRENSEVRSFLFGAKGTVRVLAIPDIDKSEKLEGRGWFFNREVEATALLLAALTSAEIETRGDGNVADDLQKLMEQLTGNAVPREYLYLMLSRSETSGMLDALLPAEYKDDRDPFGWLAFLVKNLLLRMPIRPFDATDQLAQRRKTLWSV